VALAVNIPALVFFFPEKTGEALDSSIEFFLAPLASPDITVNQDLA
jgi:hypothetical protein